MTSTYSPKPADIDRQWYVVDADGATFGRLCTQVARVLTGKNKPMYAPHIDTGDFVIVVNAAKIVLTGSKETDKVYYRHSQKPGSLKQETAGDLKNRLPSKLIEKGVWGMLPKNRLGRRQLRKLKVYAGPEHRHEAQKPQPLSVA